MYIYIYIYMCVDIYIYMCDMYLYKSTYTYSKREIQHGAADGSMSLGSHEVLYSVVVDSGQNSRGWGGGTPHRGGVDGTRGRGQVVEKGAEAVEGEDHGEEWQEDRGTHCHGHRYGDGNDQHCDEQHQDRYCDSLPQSLQHTATGTVTLCNNHRHQSDDQHQHPHRDIHTNTHAKETHQSPKETYRTSQETLQTSKETHHMPEETDYMSQQTNDTSNETYHMSREWHLTPNETHDHHVGHNSEAGGRGGQRRPRMTWEEGLRGEECKQGGGGWRALAAEREVGTGSEWKGARGCVAAPWQHREINSVGVSATSGRPLVRCVGCTVCCSLMR